MEIRFGVAALVLSLAAATACVDSECDDGCWPDTAAAVSSPIIGGTYETGFPAVGAVLLDGGLCTGTLVSPRVVLTAAHCLVGATPRAFVVGSSIYSGTRLAVQSFKAHPDYEAETLEYGSKLGWAYIAWHDIGVIILSKPSTITPMPMTMASVATMVGKTVTFVGFGNREPYDGYAVGQKYKVSVPMYDVWKQGFWNVTSSSDPKMTCGGDSGGPAFVTESDGVMRLVGVVSSGDEDCVRTGYNTRLDTNLTWVNAQIAAYGGTVVEPECGDDVCNGQETPFDCPEDCGEPPAVCGDKDCNGGETKFNCPQDCGQPEPWCGDWKCNGDETPDTCPKDCGQPGPVCGDGTCDEGESAADCPGDCPPAGFWAPCTGHQDCPEGLCVQAEDRNRCTRYCDDPEGGLGCPDGYYCVPLAAPPPSGDGACMPSGTRCGDGLCGRGEAFSTCPGDCRQGCGDVTGVGCCDGSVLTWCDTNGEVKQVFCGTDSCGWADDLGYYDCGRSPAADPSGTYPIGCGRIGQSCGDGVCDPNEDAVTCATDCRVSLAVCGNGACEAGEDCLNCRGDCPECDVGEIIARAGSGCAAAGTSGNAGRGAIAFLLALSLGPLLRARIRRSPPADPKSTAFSAIRSSIQGHLLRCLHRFGARCTASTPAPKSACRLAYDPASPTSVTGLTVDLGRSAAIDRFGH